MWVISGYSNGYRNDAWYSSDGINWNPATTNAAFPGRGEFTSLVYNNAMWLIGGCPGEGIFLNDVWYSTDGQTWTAATTQAAFIGRCDLTSLAYNNAMWVIGGGDGKFDQEGNFDYAEVPTNDVWYSIDGKTWNAATTQAAFPARADHTSVVYDGAMWVIGGQNIYGNLNDAWYSYDGINWREAPVSSSYPARFSFTSLVYSSTKGPGKVNAIWNIGGAGNTGFVNDVWYNPF